MFVYTLYSGYDDGYEKWDKDYNGTVFRNREAAEKARQHLLENGYAQDSDDYFCYIHKSVLYKSVDEWLKQNTSQTQEP